MEKLPWIEKDVEVVVYHLGGGKPEAHTTTVERVNKLTFSVRNSTRRFELHNGLSRESGSWAAGYRAVLASSDEAKHELQRLDDWKRRHHVRMNYERWTRNPTFAHRQALIDALNAIKNDEE